MSWSRLYPVLLYPGEQKVPEGSRDVPPFARTSSPLTWYSPRSWWRAGRSLQGSDLVIIVLLIPAQVPALMAIVRAFRSRMRRRDQRRNGKVVVLAHNVRPHEAQPAGDRLVGALVQAADGVLVHSSEMARQARDLGARRVSTAPLPPHLPGGCPTSEQRSALLAERGSYRAAGHPLRILSLGIVRHYKGVDLLLEAVRPHPEVRVTVAGEQWGDAGRRVRELAAAEDLDGRVRLVQGYVPAEQMADLLRQHDVVALTYRSATASQNVLLARAYGLPVIASRVGTFPEQVRDGVDGILVPPSDVAAISAAISRIKERGTVDHLASNVPEPDLDGSWHTYVRTVENLYRAMSGA